MGHDDDQLAEIKAELYALPPDRFTEARNTLAKRAGGPLGRAVRSLRRPTLSAWLVNLLAAHRSEELAELLAIGDRLREAHRSLRGPELRRLSARRQAVITSLVALARDLAAEHGREIRDDTVREAETTLRAALADPETAAQVRAGTLTRPAEYSGLGMPGIDTLTEPGQDATASQRDAAAPEPDRDAAEPAGDDARVADDAAEVPPPAQGRRARLRVILGGRSGDSRQQAAPPDRREPDSRQRAERERAERAAALDAAEHDLAEATEAEREVTRRLGEIAAEFDELRTRERQLRGEQAEADRDRRRAQRRRQAAEKAVADARRRLR